MNTDRIESLIVGYIRDNLSPTGQERERISGLYNDLKNFFSGQTFQSGSYARFTSTTPVNDLDVFYVLPDDIVRTVRVAEARIDPQKLDLQNIIQTLAIELQDFYGKSATVKPQPHSVGVYFGGEDDFSIDVVPAIPSADGMYWVPESAHLSVRKRRSFYASEAVSPTPGWIKSDPKGYIEQAKRIDALSEGRFRKTAKSVKKWKNSCESADPEFPLKSFHIELIITEMFAQNPDSICIEQLKAFFEALPGLLQQPRYPDRADPTRFIDEYVSELSEEQSSTIQNLCSEGIDILKAMENSAEPSGIIELFQALLRAEQPEAESAIGESSAAVFPLGDQSHCQPPEWPESLEYTVHIDGYLYSKNGTTKFRGINTNARFRSELAIKYVAKTKVPLPFDVYWQVVNTGEHARQNGGLRGGFFLAKTLGNNPSPNSLVNWERSEYTGKHWIECFIVKEGHLVARSGRFYVNIKNPRF